MHIAGQAAVTAMEKTENVEQNLLKETATRENILAQLNKELEEKGTVLNNELSSLKDNNNYWLCSKKCNIQSS
jgi:hypothetical protein